MFISQFQDYTNKKHNFAVQQLYTIGKLKIKLIKTPTFNHSITFITTLFFF